MPVLDKDEDVTVALLELKEYLENVRWITCYADYIVLMWPL